MAKGRTQDVAITIPGLSADDTGAPDSGFILVVEGPEAAGKSRLALQAPSGIAYHSLNIGSDRVIKQARADGKKVHLGSWEYDIPKFVRGKSFDDYWEPMGEKINAEVYQPFLASWQASAKHSAIRTLVQDRCDEFWELAQRSNFGKLQQNSQLNYGPVNDEFINPIKKAKREGKIVILIHEVKQDYRRFVNDKGVEKSEEIPGKFKRAGHRQMAGLADAIVRLHYVEGETRNEKDSAGRLKKVPVPARWETEIIRAKHNMSANGERFETVDFATLMATFLKPEADAALWED